MFAPTSIRPNGDFDVVELPAGDYFLTQPMVTDDEPLATVSIADGENKSITLPTLKSSQRGLLQVRPYTTEGLPLPGCDVTLTGAKGDVPCRSTHSAEVSFTTEPGSYRLTVSYPGFASVTKQIDVKPTPNGRWGPDRDLNVAVVRLTEQTRTDSK